MIVSELQKFSISRRVLEKFIQLRSFERAKEALLSHLNYDTPDVEYEKLIKKRIREM